MKKQQYLEALQSLITKARKESYQANQDAMIDAFEQQESERVDLFNNDEEVGYLEELQDSAQRFQGNWSYENNCHLDPIF